MKYTCKECTFNTDNPQSWCQHKNTKKHQNNLIAHEYKYNCNFCNYSVDNRKKWYKHKNTIKHNKNLDIKKEDFYHKCENCKFYSNNIQSWYSHIKSKQHEKYIDNLEITIYDENTNECKKTKNINDLLGEKNHDDNIMDNLYKTLKSGNDITDIIKNINYKNNVNIETSSNIINEIINTDKNINIINIQQNIQNNNITINNYGKENIIEHIDENKLNMVLKMKNNPSLAFNYLLNSVYFSIPENNNIKYKNIKSKKCLVLTNNGYETANIEDTFEERVEKIANIDKSLKQKFNKNFNPEVFNNMNEFIWDGSQMSISEFRELFMPKKLDLKYKNNKSLYKQDIETYFNSIKVMREYKKLKQKYMMSIYNLNK